MKSTNDRSFFTYLLILVILLQYSCSEEESIVGTWQLKSIDSVCDVEDPEFTIEYVDSEESDCIIKITKETTSTIELTRMEEICWSIKFNEDNTGIQYSGLPDLKSTVSFVYTVDDTNSVVEICVGNDCLNFDYDGNMLSFSTQTQFIDPSGCANTFTFTK